MIYVDPHDIRPAFQAAPNRAQGVDAGVLAQASRLLAASRVARAGFGEAAAELAEIWQVRATHLDPATRGQLADAIERTFGFLLSLPADMPMPTIGATDDGEVMLHWRPSATAQMAVILGPEVEMHYTGWIGTDSFRGRQAYLGVVPLTLLRQLNRVLSQTYTRS